MAHLIFLKMEALRNKNVNVADSNIIVNDFSFIILITSANYIKLLVLISCLDIYNARCNTCNGYKTLICLI